MDETNNVVVEDYPALVELDNMLNEAWANGYIDGYVSVIRKEPNYSEHREDYEGRMLEEYESGYLSAIKGGNKWTRKYSYSKGYTDGYKTSKLEWKDFGFFSFWRPVYTGELLKRYNIGYSAGFVSGFHKQKDYEWALGFVNQLRNPTNQLVGKNHHNDHGILLYPELYEDGYKAAKTFYQYHSLDEAQRAINFSRKTLWIIGFIDGKHYRKERFGNNLFDTNTNKLVFDNYSEEYCDGYKAGIFTYWNRDMEMKELESNSNSIVFIDSFRKQRKEEFIWIAGYVDGRLNGILRHGNYQDDEYDIYKSGYDIGYSESKEEAFDENKAVSLYSFHDIVKIENKLDVWKLGVISGFTGNSDRPNENIFHNERNLSGLFEDNTVNIVNSDLYEAYKDGCQFGYEHTYESRWKSAYEVGEFEGYDYVSEGKNEKQNSRDNYKGFELEAYDKGFIDGCNSAEKENNNSDNDYDSTSEWTMKDSYDAMTDGMYGDYDGDVDFDKFGF